MRQRLDRSRRRIELVFDDPRELEEFLDRSRRLGAFKARLDGAVRAEGKLTLTLVDSRGRRELAVRLRQVFRSGAAHYVHLLEPEDEEMLASLQPAGRPEAEAAAGDPSPAPPDAPPPEAAVNEAPPGAAEIGEEADETEADAPVTAGPTGEEPEASESPAFRIRRMNVSERMRLATRASRVERQILLRDSSPQVLLGLLANPRIEEKEVLEVVKSHHAAAGLLQRVVGDRRWKGSYAIKLALVKNPKTPTPLALKLVPGLHKNDLRALGKSGEVREAIKGAALRLYLSRQ